MTMVSLIFIVQCVWEHAMTDLIKYDDLTILI